MALVGHRRGATIVVLILALALPAVGHPAPAAAERPPERVDSGGATCRTVGYEHTCKLVPRFDAEDRALLQSLVVPPGVSEMHFDVGGGRGGGGFGDYYMGGDGGRVQATFDVTQETLTFGLGEGASGRRGGRPSGGDGGVSESFPGSGGSGGGAASVVGRLVTNQTLILAGGGGGAGGGAQPSLDRGEGEGGHAGHDGAKGYDEYDEEDKAVSWTGGGHGGRTPVVEGTSVRFQPGGSGGVSCDEWDGVFFGKDGGVATATAGGAGGFGGHGGGGGGGGGGSGGGGSGRKCMPVQSLGEGGGGGGGVIFVNPEGRDAVLGRNPEPDGRAIVTFTVAEGTRGFYAPETFLLSTRGLDDTDRAPRFRFEGFDDTSVVGYECRIDDGAFTPCASGDAHPVDIGERTFTVRAVDGEGNVDPSPPSYTWTVREIVRSPVELSLHPDQANPTNRFGLNQTLSFRVKTAEGQAYQWEGGPGRGDPCLDSIEVNGRPNHGWFGPMTSFFPRTGNAVEESPGVWRLSLVTSLNTSSGTYSMRLGEGCFRSAAGDASLASNETSFILDDHRPDTTITAGPPPQLAPQPVVFAFEGTDAHSGIAGFECRLGDAAFSACTSPITYEDLPVGPHTFQVRAVDRAGNVDGSPATATFRINSPPIVDAGADVSGDEGAALLLEGAASNPDGDELALTWTAPDDAPCAFEDASAPATTIRCTDDGVFTVTLTADDGFVTASDTAIVTVANVAPTVGTVTGLNDPVRATETVTLAAPFTDPGTDDTHTCAIDWGDGTTTAGTVADLTCTGTHAYGTPGVHTVTVTVTDDDGDAGTGVHEYAVVFEPDGGFVTGGGWIDSPPGAYQSGSLSDAEVTGRANFGFVSRYHRGARVPEGNTRFQFSVADLDFRSTAYEWLVISGARAQYKGEGTINGTGRYGFILTAIDGDQSGGGGVDRFRIKIWDKDRDDAVVYDNQRGDADDGNARQALGGGSIRIHTGQRR